MMLFAESFFLHTHTIFIYVYRLRMVGWLHLSYMFFYNEYLWLQDLDFKL